MVKLGLGASLSMLVSSVEAASGGARCAVSRAFACVRSPCSSEAPYFSGGHQYLSRGLAPWYVSYDFEHGDEGLWGPTQNTTRKLSVRVRLLYLKCMFLSPRTSSGLKLKIHSKRQQNQTNTTFITSRLRGLSSCFSMIFDSAAMMIAHHRQTFETPFVDEREKPSFEHQRHSSLFHSFASQATQDLLFHQH